MIQEVIVTTINEDDTVHIFYVQCECFVYLQTFLSNGECLQDYNISM